MTAINSEFSKFAADADAELSLDAKLQAVIDGPVSDKTRAFADSLLNGKWGLLARGYLSAKQKMWADKLYAETEAKLKAQAAPAADTAFAELPQVKADRVFDLFDTAKAAGVKYPKITIVMHGHDHRHLRLYLSGPASKAPGTLQMLTEDDTGDLKAWLGRIGRDNHVTASYHGKAHLEAALRTVRELNENPAEAAADHGHLTGNCCFCHKLIKTDASLAVGYGPKCAEKFGLPWGETGKA